MNWDADLEKYNIPFLKLLSRTQQQSEYLNKFAIDYNKRTLKSKEMEIVGRPKFSDMRTAIGFRIETKEMAYPIMAT